MEMLHNMLQWIHFKHRLTWDLLRCNQMNQNYKGCFDMQDRWLTCDKERDGVWRGPSSLWVVCLKPKVVLSSIAKLHVGDLDPTAFMAACILCPSSVRHADPSWSQSGGQTPSSQRPWTTSPSWQCVLMGSHTNRGEWQWPQPRHRSLSGWRTRSTCYPQSLEETTNNTDEAKNVCRVSSCAACCWLPVSQINTI